MSVKIAENICAGKDSNLKRFYLTAEFWEEKSKQIRNRRGLKCDRPQAVEDVSVRKNT